MTLTLDAPRASLDLLVWPRQGDAAASRACAHGELVRVATGRYVAAPIWAALDAAERHVLRTMAELTRTSRALVVSHRSAAVFWRMPSEVSRPTRVETTDPESTWAQSTPSLIARAGPLLDSEIVDLRGLRVTSALRTAVDVALVSSFGVGVVVFDSCLQRRLFSRAELLDEVARRAGARGFASTLRAAHFSSELAESAGESWGRVAIHELGFPEPVLQWPVTDADGFAGRSDFAWLDEASGDLLGETDGLVKYLDAQVRAGLSAEDVVVREKLREDRLRAAPGVRGLVRWTKDDVVHPHRLVAKLETAGLTRSTRWHSPPRGLRLGR
ncbi:hypothetical protein ACPEEZ_05465 [Frigoribacterium sp. 2-23]|uniref:hypothetical protein n=1 Tax=Frigoribacterium sp. 2-23 TaxID=3415006 RepID=UPI003C701243